MLEYLLFISKNVICIPVASIMHSEHSFFLGVSHLSPPKIANYSTGVPILSKHTLSVASGGAMH